MEELAEIMEFDFHISFYIGKCDTVSCGCHPFDPSFY